MEKMNDRMILAVARKKEDLEISIRRGLEDLVDVTTVEVVIAQPCSGKTHLRNQLQGSAKNFVVDIDDVQRIVKNAIGISGWDIIAEFGGVSTFINSDDHLSFNDIDTIERKPIYKLFRAIIVSKLMNYIMFHPSVRRAKKFVFLIYSPVHMYMIIDALDELHGLLLSERTSKFTVDLTYCKFTDEKAFAKSWETRQSKPEGRKNKDFENYELESQHDDFNYMWLGFNDHTKGARKSGKTKLNIPIEMFHYSKLMNIRLKELIMLNDGQHLSDFVNYDNIFTGGSDIE